MLEVVAQRLARVDQRRFAQAFPIARAHDVVGQQDALAVGSDLIDRDREVGVRAVDRQPGGQLEEAGDLGVGRKRRRLVDELLAVRGCDQPLIDQVVGVHLRLQIGLGDIPRVIDIPIRLAGSDSGQRQRPCPGQPVGVARRIQEEWFRLRRHRVQGVGITPEVGAHHVIGDRLAQEGGARSVRHGPGIPVPLQLLQVDHRGRPKLDPAHLRRRGSGAFVIPRADDEVMASALLSRRAAHEVLIESQRAGLVGVVAAGHRQDRDIQGGVLGAGRRIGVEIGVDLRMVEPFA